MDFDVGRIFFPSWCHIIHHAAKDMIESELVQQPPIAEPAASVLNSVRS